MMDVALYRARIQEDLTTSAVNPMVRVGPLEPMNSVAEAHGHRPGPLGQSVWLFR